MTTFVRLLACLALAATAFRAQSATVDVRIADADWGDATPAEIRPVLEATAAEVMRFFPALPALGVRVAPTDGAPMVLFARESDGAYQVQLRARDREWAHYAYEFAHELGHIVANYGRHAAVPGLARHQWFEEAVCEMLSLYVLRRLSQRFPGEQGAAFAAFAELAMSEPHRRSAHGLDLRRWIAENEAELARTPYRRKANEIVATRLLEVVEREPRTLYALRYLNAAQKGAPASFAGYLEDWCDATPAHAKPFVRRIMAVFGLGSEERPEAYAAGLSLDY